MLDQSESSMYPTTELAGEAYPIARLPEDAPLRPSW